MPEVSVILPAYNARETIERAVRGILRQTFVDFELILIDDGSTDGTGSIIAGFGDPRIRILRNPRNIGLTRSLNRGLARASAELIARQDADDYSFPDRIEKQVSFLKTNENVALLGSWGLEVRDDGTAAVTRRATSNLGIRWESLFYNSFIHTAVMFRKSVVWDALGGYDESVSYCQDYELWSRVMERHDVANLEDALVERYIEPGSMTETMQDRRAYEARNAAYRHFRSLFRPLPVKAYSSLFEHYFAGQRISARDYLISTRHLLREFRLRYPESADIADFWQAVSRRFLHTASASWESQKILCGLAMCMGLCADPRGVMSHFPARVEKT